MIKEKKLKKYFKDSCEEKFHFLESKHRCKLVDIYDGETGLSLIYKNATTGVSINLNLKEGRINIDLMRLVNGKIPELVYDVKVDSVLNEFDFDDLLSIRGKEKLIKPEPDKLVHDKGCEKNLELLLDKYAAYLSEFACDVLDGEFLVFEKLEHVVKSRL